jgi:hypothetical protein
MYRHTSPCLQGPLSRRCKGQLPHGPATGIRLDLVERVRREIAEGTYETPDKLEMALARLFQRLDEE